jgi:hypothetical protein
MSMSQHDAGDDWVRAQVSAVIERPPGIVFAFVCDPGNDPLWLGKIGEVRRLTPGPFGLGSRFRQSATFLGARVEGEWEVTEFVADARMRSRSVAGPFVFTRGYDCDADGAATRITKFVAVSLSGALAFLPRATADALLNRASERALVRLKSVLEGKCAPHTTD